MSRFAGIVLSGVLLAFVCGCPPIGATGGDVSATALNYGGAVAGNVAMASRTNGDVDLGSTAKYLARAQAANGIVWLTDLAGNRLRNVLRNEYPDFPLNPDGSFSLGALPVGVDIVLHVDLDNDGLEDFRTIIHIPRSADDAGAGQLAGLRVDPLSTVTGNKLAAIFNELGVDPRELDFSAAGVLGETRQAYEGLYDSAGILDEIGYDEIAGMSPQELAAFFDQFIPEGARRGMGMAHGRIGLMIARDAEAVAKAAARILLQGGVAIADEAGGVDFSELAQIPNVEARTFAEFFGEKEGMQMARAGFGTVEESLAMVANQAPDVEVVVYVHTRPEVNRNWADDMGGADELQGPMIGEHILIRMAEAYLDGKTISIDELRTILVDPRKGLGIRLVYSKWNGPHQPPTEVFQTADGLGVEKDIWGPNGLMGDIMELELMDPRANTWEQKKSHFRDRLLAFLEGTTEPTLEELFHGVLMERVPNPEEFGRILREQRVHVPWSLTGPSQMYVLATADPFRDSAALAVTVDVQTNERGQVTGVSYNTQHSGEFYVGFGPHTHDGMLVEFVRRTNGRPLHDHEGVWQQLEIANETIFQAINGVSFLETFSELETMWPMAPVLRLHNHEFDPALPEHPETNPRFFEAMVLLTSYEPGAGPATVDYDETTGAVTYSSDGEYYLLDDGQTWQTGLFALISSDGQIVEQTRGDWDTRVLVDPADVAGLTLQMQQHRWFYGMEVANPAYDPAGAPYWDDISDDGVQDAGEPVFSDPLWLENPNDWRSTWVEQYYRRADNNGFPDPMEINWEAATPQLDNGVALVPRNLKRRLNGYRFGRPNVTINLLVTFSPPDFFNGTHAINGSTRINPFMMLALVNLVFESTKTVDALVDPDGPGPAQPRMMPEPAYYFTPPIGDPVQMMAEGFRDLAQRL